MAGLIADNFDKIPGGIRNQVLLRIGNSRQSDWYTIARIISSEFDKIPEGIRNELLP